MSDQLLDTAYMLAIQHYRLAELSVFSDLLPQFPDADLGTLLHTAERSIQLHIAAIGLARTVWAKVLSFEKAEEMLITQFSEFPISTCEQAFGDAYTETRGSFVSGLN